MNTELMKAEIKAELSRLIFDHDNKAIMKGEPLFPLGATGIVNRGMDELFDKWRKSDEQ